MFFCKVTIIITVRVANVKTLFHSCTLHNKSVFNSNCITFNKAQMQNFLASINKFKTIRCLKKHILFVHQTIRIQTNFLFLLSTSFFPSLKKTTPKSIILPFNQLCIQTYSILRNVLNHFCTPTLNHDHQWKGYSATPTTWYIKSAYFFKIFIRIKKHNFTNKPSDSKPQAV